MIERRRIPEISDPQARAFAEACYNTRSLDELREYNRREPDDAHMLEWGITARQWREAVGAALHDRLADEDKP